MQTKDVTVRLQALDGPWEVGGVDRKRGIVPENVSPGADGWGSSTVSFDLRRDPRAIWPDLGSSTPIEIEIGGAVVWSGSISDTPTRDAADRVISVQAGGKQYHLDDDVYERQYVHTRIADWRDGRTYPGVDLSAWKAAPGVASDNGVVTLTFAQGQLVTSHSYVGVVLDLGENSSAASISVDWESSNNSGPCVLYARAAPSVAALNAGPVADAFTVANNAGASATTHGTFSTPYRYVALFMYLDTTDSTPAADIWFRLAGVRVFCDDAYRSTDASVLRASTVIDDALDRATVLLSSDRSGIETTSFDIPDFGLTDPKTPREAWAAINAYHDWICKIDVAGRPIFKPKPTVPLFEVGNWSPLELEDQSANSGEEIYNKVIVTATAPDGSPLRVVRQTVDTGAVLTRTISGAMFWDGSSTLRQDLTDVADTADAYVTYRITVAVLATAGKTFTLRFGDLDAGDYAETETTAPTADPYEVVFNWTARAASSNLAAEIVPISGPAGGGIVNFVMSEPAAPTLVDRRRFFHTKVLPLNGAMTPEACTQLGDIFLAAHRTTPYKGSFKLTGDRSVRLAGGGDFVPLERLLLHTGELIRDTAAIDPDTGGIGRDGRIAAVTYNPSAEEATVTLDNSRASFEALLERLAVITGSN